MLAPGYAAIPKSWGVNIATANAARDGTGTAPALVTPTLGVRAAKVENIKIKARATTTAGMIRFFLNDGTNKYFFTEQTIAAVTPSATVKAEEYNLDFSTPDKALFVPVGWTLMVATNNAEAFDISAQGGEF